ncbi:hypothetical protein CEXT_316621 [Caerostris extrusa]|uniref:Uncharacterized protein n=1 Tax=Caerostris extrusa TaxID=172846 RepID=A0AAV4RDU5_CAEEX|nr:hypothetical protein CEXT_316621 [Caerostris extrusa]
MSSFGVQEGNPLIIILIGRSFLRLKHLKSRPKFKSLFFIRRCSTSVETVILRKFPLVRTEVRAGEMIFSCGSKLPQSLVHLTKNGGIRGLRTCSGGLSSATSVLLVGLEGREKLLVRGMDLHAS